MKHFYFILLLIGFYACANNEEVRALTKEIPNTYVLESTTTAKEGLLYWDNKKYSGFVYELNAETGDTLLLESYYKGLKDGLSKKWYTGNELMELRHYADGQKNGEQIAYWVNGNTRFEYTAKDDAYEGELKEWNEDGFLFHIAHYVNGQEEGEQKLWYDNGKVRANYVIIDGKRYGLLGTKNCVNVSDSIFFNQ
ncbi:toxin-antitoxin system YwqK family antitoxin [Crocinitomix catalasitica]|uniref:toxin-antitoxin system YwqK family antitoxin n=1 Tax=Crocinitomix catalasitica TaxID=184607 RepID=UPI001B80E0EB|nr:toxin-antitoxin system YwqK family antitoxin [Crocinitomix catalasitica]